MLKRGPFPTKKIKEGDGLKLIVRLSHTNGYATRKEHLLTNSIMQVQRNHVHEDVNFLHKKICEKISPGFYELHVARNERSVYVWQTDGRHHSLTSHLKLYPCCGTEEEILSEDSLAGTWVGEAIRLKERHLPIQSSG